MHKHSGCCGCSAHTLGRRTFLAAMGGASMAASMITQRPARASSVALASGPRSPLDLGAAKLKVQPVLAYQLFTRHETTSWRPWGGLHTEADIEQEVQRIQSELALLAGTLEFPLEIQPVLKARTAEEAQTIREGESDVMLVYAASSDQGVIENLLSENRHNLLFVRHKSGPVYLWYEIAHPRLLRKTFDECRQPGLGPWDVIVDSQDEIGWRLRSLHGLNNTVGSKILTIGGAAGWGEGGENAPQIARDLWKLGMEDVAYEELGERILAIREDSTEVERSIADAAAYLASPGTESQVDKGYVERAFLLKQLFVQLMREHDCRAITVNHCMGAIMPLSETTACLTLSLLNDEGLLAFCESDFAVIPSGILLHYISGLPVFLQDPTYPHDGLVTIAHCTAPRKMDGKTLEPALLLSHFESDYGAAPKVEMKVGQEVTVIDPDFTDEKWLGFRATIVDNPFLDICRSQIDIRIEGDWKRLVEEMRGFHWMMSYGNYLKETGYALKKLGIEWVDLSEDAGRIG